MPYQNPKERRSPTSRALRTAIATALFCAAGLLLLAAYSFFDKVPEESHWWWMEPLAFTLAFAVPAVVVRAIMRSRRGKGPKPPAAPRT